MCGWIKIHRQITDWEWYEDLPVRVLFMHLLLKASFTDSRTRGVDVPRGSLMTGINKLSDETKLTVRQIRTALKKLKSTNEVTIKSHTKFSIITISNYNQYQSIDKQDDKQETNNRHDRDYIIRKEKGKKETNNIGDSQTSQEKAALTRALTSEFDSEVWDNLKTYSNNKYDGSLKQYLALRRNGYTKDEISKCYYDLELVNRNDPSYARQLCKVTTLTNIKQWKKDLDNNLKEQNKQEQQDPDLEAKRREVLGL